MYEQQRKPAPYGRDIVFRIADGALRSGHARLAYARDANANMHAVNFVVFDERSAHYLIGGSDRRFHGSGAASLLMWDAIQFAAQHSLVFDFEGSMVQGIERFFRSFNPTLVPYNRVYKAGRWFAPLMSLRDGVLSLLGRRPQPL
jgi:hypothetical protein